MASPSKVVSKKLAPSDVEVQRIRAFLRDQYGLRPSSPGYDAAMKDMLRRWEQHAVKQRGASKGTSWDGGSSKRGAKKSGGGSSGAR